MKIYFSPSLALLYAENMVSDGSYGESLPVDLIETTNSEEDTYWRASPPDGKVLGAINGRPAWVDVPPLSEDQQTDIAKMQRSQLRIAADSEINWRQDAVDAEIASEEEATDLGEWKKYRVALMRVDPSSPEWPVPPDKK